MSLTIDPQPTKTDIYQGAVKVASVLESGIITYPNSPISKDASTLANTDGVLLTGIPDGVSEVDFTFLDLVHSSANQLVVQIGSAAGLVTSGYQGTTVAVAGTNLVSQQTSDAGVPLFRSNSGQIVTGTMRLRLVDRANNGWVIESSGWLFSGSQMSFLSAARGVFLPSRLTQLRLLPLTAGSFSAGRVNATYR